MAYYCDIAEEYGTLASAATSTLRFTIAEQATTTSGLKHALATVLADEQLLQSDVTGRRAGTLSSNGLLQSGITHTSHYVVTAGSTPYAESGLVTVLNNLVAEEASLQSGASSSTYTLFGEDPTAQSGATHSAHLISVLGDSAQVSGTASAVSSVIGGDTASLQSGISSLRYTTDTVAETLTAQSAASHTASLLTLDGDSATLQSAVACTVHGAQTVGEVASLYSDVVARSTGAAWTANTDTFGMSRYTDYPLRSLAVVGGRLVGLTDAALYTLDGDTDDGAPIAASITDARRDFGTDKLKQIGELYVGGQSDGDITLSVETTSVKGDTEQNDYDFTARELGAVRNTRVKLGRGLRSRYWRFTLSNSGGARLVVHNASAQVEELSRRL